MTVTSATNRADFAGNGSTTIFPFTFRIFDDTDLQVFEGLTGSTVLKVLNTDYTVTINPDGTGDVVFITAPVNLSVIIVIRVLPLTQLVDFPVAGKFPASANEEAEDRGVMLHQQKAEEDGRRITLAIDSGLSNIELPSPGAGLFFRWNLAGTALELISVTASDTSDVIVARGDLIRGGIGGVAEALSKDPAESIVKSGVLDLEYLPVGTNGQILTVVAGVMTWVTPVPAAVVETGSMLPFGGAAAPTGYVLCDGTAISRTTFAALFAVLGTAYGVGDGSTTFNVPDLRGRLPLGKDDMGGVPANRVTAAAADTLGGALGAENHTLIISELPSHTHLYERPNPGAPAIGTGPAFQIGAINTSPNTATSATGSGVAHPNLQPSQTANYIIKT